MRPPRPTPPPHCAAQNKDYCGCPEASPALVDDPSRVNPNDFPARPRFGPITERDVDIAAFAWIAALRSIAVAMRASGLPGSIVVQEMLDAPRIDKDYAERTRELLRAEMEAAS